MSTLLKPGERFATPTPKGIEVTQVNPQHQPEQVALIPFAEALSRFDGGGHDHQLTEGLRIALTLLEAEHEGYYLPTPAQQVICWRWLVVALFIAEQAEANGVIDIPNEDGSTDHAALYLSEDGGIPVYPAVERFSLANHIESLAIEKYGLETGSGLALRFYQDMVEVGESGLQLSERGREGLALLHDGFIKQIREEGLPDAPVAH